MELRQLKYFVAAARTLNISRASKDLNVSQPAVSRMIRDLEAELQIKLFTRKPNGLSLTPQGEALLDIARRVLRECAEAKTFVQDSPQRTTELVVGFTNTAIASFLGDALRQFRRLYPNAPVRIHELLPGDQIAALRNGEIDLAFLAEQDVKMNGEFELLVVKEVPLQAAVPSSHTLAQEKAVKLKDLKEETFFGYNEEKFPGYNQMVSHACAAAGFRPVLAYKSGSLFELLGMVGAGMGICLMPSDISALSHSQVVFIPIVDAIEPVCFAAVWRPGTEQIPLRNFLACLKSRSIPG